MTRYLAMAGVFAVGLISGAAGAVVVLGPRQFNKGLELGRHEIRLEAIKADAGTMRNGRFVWTAAR